MTVLNGFPDVNIWLMIGGVLSALAAVLHVAIVLKGASWYRFFGAGEKFARAAERGEHWQDFVTLAIAAVLALWSTYAFAGSGLIAELPYMPAALVTISAVYLLRGIALVPALVMINGEGRVFAIWSSLICLIYGMFHAIGLIQIWPSM